jgi:AcrR family transcriptional regulator
VTVAARKARQQAQIREKILSAARDLFLAHGYEAVSMRKIAAAIEYTPPVIYTHFKDKADLLQELCLRDFTALAQRFTRLGRIDDPVQRILRAGLSYVRFALEHPNHYRLMFMTPPPPIEPDEQCLALKGDPEVDAYGFLEHAVRQAIAAGRFRSEYQDPELVTQVLWAGVHGLASLQITHKDDPWIRWRSVDRLARGVCRSMLRGMLADPAELEDRP